VFKRLKELREDRDLSQYDIADILQMSQTGYSKYETGEVAPSVKALIVLSNLYNVSIDNMLGLTNNPQRK
jgi:transcriptional regulator with XRE-family HTH domain